MNMNTDIDLFSPITIGDLNLPNRIVMTPLTRSRAGEGNAPTEMNATYYAQRASAGLIISEATQISPEGVGYIFTPGIHSDEQIAGWKKVTQAVHDKGGRIFLQLWHVGRISHPFFQPDNALPVAPSSIKPDAQAFTENGKEDCPTPRALETAEVEEIILQYGKAAQNAKDAGFDGVEIHGANGYLIDQFIRDGTNKRDDIYGGSVENRCRFALEVVEEVIKVWGPERVGIRLSPTGTFNDMHDSDPKTTFTTLVEKLNAYNLCYLHVVEPFSHDHPFSSEGEEGRLLAPLLREIFDNAFMLNGGMDKRHGTRAIKSGLADFVSFGVPYIANPDLVERFKKDAPLNEPDKDTFYGGDEKGYIDYPALEETGDAA
jgi:N-ethylmaleimide reductase